MKVNGSVDYAITITVIRWEDLLFRATSTRFSEELKLRWQCHCHGHGRWMRNLHAAAMLMMEDITASAILVIMKY
jgi:hypothetical protein